MEQLKVLSFIFWQYQGYNYTIFRKSFLPYFWDSHKSNFSNTIVFTFSSRIISKLLIISVKSILILVLLNIIARRRWKGKCFSKPIAYYKWKINEPTLKIRFALSLSIESSGESIGVCRVNFVSNCETSSSELWNIPKIFIFTFSIVNFNFRIQNRILCNYKCRMQYVSMSVKITT